MVGWKKVTMEGGLFYSYTVNRVKSDSFSGFQNPCSTKASSRGSENRASQITGFLNSARGLCV